MQMLTFKMTTYMDFQNDVEYRDGVQALGVHGDICVFY